MDAARLPNDAPPEDARPEDAVPHVAVRGLHFAYGPAQPPLFSEFDWRVARGEMWALIGPSGCGKSTLLYLLAGLRRPQAGVIEVGGFPVPRPRAATGLILQDHGLLPWATVRDNANLGLRIGHFYRHKSAAPTLPRPYPPDLPQAVADGWLARLGLADLADKYPAQLSGGQRQRVAIARALALQPDLLLMDEPFSALDSAIRADLQTLVIELQRELGVTTLIVTHSLEEAAVLGRRILCLGNPPNRHAQIIDNPAAGAPEFRTTAAYRATLAELRARLHPPNAGSHAKSHGAPHEMA
jgi:NitT/TauT family transport system ATP-binding protein